MNLLDDAPEKVTDDPIPSERLGDLDVLERGHARRGREKQLGDRDRFLRRRKAAGA